MKSKYLRILDVVLATVGLLITLPLLVLLFIIGLFDTGSPLFKQERVGRYKLPFTLIKFRTMKLNTASVATHLANSSSVTQYGVFLRKTKLDELPQLYNVLIGDMSLVGPRPCLFSQEELITEREKRNVFKVCPGITGLAQVNNIDMSTPILLAKVDEEMINTLSFKLYVKYIFQTIKGKGNGDSINKPRPKN